MNARAPNFHVFHSSFGSHVLLTRGSRIYDLEVPEGGPAGVSEQTLCEAGLSPAGPIERQVADEALAVRSVSLNLAQSCNLACTYCYADEGRFGGRAKRMNFETARKVVDRLIEESDPGSRLLVGFMGGEPLLNRDILHRTVAYASGAARRQSKEVRFSITTNGTLINREDARLFCQYPFAVQFSLDGGSSLNDTQRPDRRGRGSYRLVSQGLATLLAEGRPLTLSARATVLPSPLELLSRLEHLIELGFDDVGFAPVLVSPNGGPEFTAAELQPFLAEMIRCGEKALSEAVDGRRFPFSNFESAMTELHRGACRPLPCGAAASYFSADSNGDFFACHRFVNSQEARIGDCDSGLDDERRRHFLDRALVDKAADCASCWARYLCGGGCHHEVRHRGRPSCDYIRGWLSFCLTSYVELSAQRPGWFREGRRQ